MYVDYNANGNFVRVSKAKLHRYFRKNINDWPDFEGWLFDMRCYDLIRERL